MGSSLHFIHYYAVTIAIVLTRMLHTSGSSVYIPVIVLKASFLVRSLLGHRAHLPQLLARDSN